MFGPPAAPPQPRAAPVAARPARVEAAPELPASTAELTELLLTSRSAAARVAAAKKLGERLPLDKHLIVPALVKATQESDAAVRRAARDPLTSGRLGGAMPGVIETLREALLERDPLARREGLVNLCSFGGFFDDAVRCLADESETVRGSAAYYAASAMSLDARPTPEQLDVLWRGLEDPAPTVRRYLLRGVGRRFPRDARVKAVVREIFADGAPYQLNDAVDVIARMPEAEAAELLDELARTRPARAALARTSFPGLAEQGVAELARLIEAGPHRVDALQAAARLPEGMGAALDALVVAAAADTSSDVREAALRALRRSVPAQTRLELARQAVKAPKREIRWAAQEVLGGLAGSHPDDVVDTVLPMLGGDDTDDFARVLGWVGPGAARAVPRLVECLELPRCSSVIYALGSIGAAARAAVPALARRVRPGAETSALDALRRIGLGRVDAMPFSLEGLEAGAREVALAALETAEDPLPAEVRDALAQSVVKEEGLPYVRSARLMRLARCGGEVTPVLVRALEDRDEAVAAQALRALQQVGPQAVPHLERMRDDPACADGPRAAWALEQLAGNG